MENAVDGTILQFFFLPFVRFLLSSPRLRLRLLGGCLNLTTRFFISSKQAYPLPPATARILPGSCTRRRQRCFLAETQPSSGSVSMHLNNEKGERVKLNACLYSTSLSQTDFFFCFPFFNPIYRFSFILFRFSFSPCSRSPASQATGIVPHLNFIMTLICVQNKNSIEAKLLIK